MLKTHRLNSSEPAGECLKSRIPAYVSTPYKSDARPVTAAIALWNTVYLGRALDAARRRGDLIPDALLAHFAPLGWQHLNLTGDYLWGADASLGPDGFRPLRGMAASLPTASAA